MIVKVNVNLKEIRKKGRDFIWEKPDNCPRCKINHLWGHGFVLRNFDDHDTPLWLKRYRCSDPSCKSVTTMRPSSHFKRISTSISKIRSCLVHYSTTRQWVSNICQIRQKRWLKILQRNTMAILGITKLSNLITAFDELMKQGWLPVTGFI